MPSKTTEKKYACYTTDERTSPFLQVRTATGKKALIPYFDLRGMDYEPADKAGQESIVLQSHMHIAVIKGKRLLLLLTEFRQMKVVAVGPHTDHVPAEQPHILSIEVAHHGSES